MPHDPSERRPLLLSFGYFFFLLASYYVLQPLRDELAGAGGVRDIPWLFQASLVVMLIANPLYAKLVAAYPRRKFLPWVYGFFFANMGLFYALLLTPGPELRVWVARSFFLWVSIFNLFAVSVFWSFMADVFTTEQAKRLFGFVGAGGTAGQLFGSSLTLYLATRIGAVNLLAISLGLLAAAMVCMRRLLDHEDAEATAEACVRAPEVDPSAPRGGAWDGIRAVLASRYLAGICAYIFLYTFTSSFLYFGKQEVARAALTDSNLRTAFFAQINLAVGVSTLVVQLFFTGQVLKRIGVSWALALVPSITAVGFLLLGQWPLLWVFAAFEVTRKAANYSLARPAREILYTVVTRTEKYQAKNFIDTFVYRGGDAVAATVFAPVQALGLGLTATTLVAAPVAVLWGVVGIALGRAQEKRASSG